jgi:7-carboxy-7-deazaguanine synthase
VRQAPVYPIAPNGIFWTLQGEGHLRGFQMAFVRLAGCSVGCSGCDTDYSVQEKLDVPTLLARVAHVMPPGDRDQWVWVTGGEPADHDLRSLLSGLKGAGYATAVATSGAKRVISPVDWLSVSPHSPDPAKFQQRYGSEIKLADGLNGVDLDAWYSEFPDDRTDFMYRYVQPLWIGDADTGREDSDSLGRCLDFLKRHPRWALSRQDHKAWRVP